MRQPKLLISIAILMIIGLHAVPFLRRGRVQRNVFWPFLTWSMYNDSRPPGPIVARKQRIIGVTAKGQKQEVTARLVGLGPPAVARLYVRPWVGGKPFAAQQLIDRINRGREDPFVEIRLETETYTVTDAGIVKKDHPAITYQVNPSESR